MKKVLIETQKAGDYSVITMAIGSVVAIYKRAGNTSCLKVSGRGNVRQVKALFREFVRSADPALI
ncbi:hypothetical protein [Xenorhabdus taiwanensis]|uniref:Uncharacterized protein n=1 Tax=Xenorhabdus taiwanensis TaxID=3085177 RepID=A0ABN7C2D9_9GAMM|nr:hypothetical protein TCT1_14400 [Xenorhabdus sp. TCT-1]